MGEGPEWVARLVDGARERARLRVLALRSAHPGEDDLALGERLVAAAANRAGLWGAATGALALVTLPVGLPAGIAVSLALEAELLLGLLHVFGFSTEGEPGRLRVYALWAGAGFASAAKSAGLRLGARTAGRIIADSLPARLIGRLNPVLLRAILRRLGLGWLPRALKLWPVLGAPLGFVLDRAALASLGSAALATLDEAARVRRRKQRGVASTRRPPAEREAAARAETAGPKPARSGAGAGRRSAQAAEKPAAQPARVQRAAPTRAAAENAAAARPAAARPVAGLAAAKRAAPKPAPALESGLAPVKPAAAERAAARPAAAKRAAAKGIDARTVAAAAPARSTAATGKRPAPARLAPPRPGPAGPAPARPAVKGRKRP